MNMCASDPCNSSKFPVQMQDFASASKLANWISLVASGNIGLNLNTSNF